MKRFIAIALLSVYLFSTTELHQLLRIKVLVEHYQEHKQKNADITFWAFLKLHYADTQHPQAEKKHDKLPFKGHDRCVTGINIICIASPAEILSLQQRPVFFESITFPLQQEYSLSSLFDANIWQPPRA